MSSVSRTPQPEPWAAIGLVVELRDEDLIARFEGASERRAQRVIERRHVLAERDAVGGWRAQEGCDGFARAQHAPVDFPGGRKVAVRIDIAGGVEIGDRIDHRSGYLAAARTVEEGKFNALARFRERRKIRPAAQGLHFGVSHYSRS